MDFKRLRDVLGRRRNDVSIGCGKVHTISWNCSGTKLACGSHDKLVCIQKFDTFCQLVRDTTLKGHTDSVDQVDWHPSDSELLASTGADEQLKFWDTRAGKSISTIGLKGENINLAWHPTGNYIAVGNKEDLISWIDIRKLSVIHEERYKFEVNEFSWDLSGDKFFMTSGNGNIHILSFPDFKQESVKKTHPIAALCLKFSPTGEHFAVGSGDASVSIWDAREIVCLRVMTRMETPLRTIGFSHDGKYLASGSEEYFLDICKVDTAEQAHCIQTLFEVPYSLAWHPKTHVIAYSYEDKEKSKYEVKGSVRLFTVPDI